MLTGKSALITGSIGGIGFATAKALAEQGCNVMLNGFADPATVQARVDELEALNVHVEYHGADLRSRSRSPRWCAPRRRCSARSTSW